MFPLPFGGGKQIDLNRSNEKSSNPIDLIEDLKHPLTPYEQISEDTTFNTDSHRNSKPFNILEPGLDSLLKPYITG